MLPIEELKSTIFEEQIRKDVADRGGFFVAHCHLDRAMTALPIFLPEGMSPCEVANLPLRAKQDIVGKIHLSPAFSEESLSQRMSFIIEGMIECGTRRLDTFIDTTADVVGLKALHTFISLREKYVEQIDLKCGSYNVFGFKTVEKKRWDLFVEASRDADFLGVLPERDERDSHIGYRSVLYRTLHLAKDLNKEIHFHVDQANIDSESGTEQLCEALSYYPQISEWNKDSKDPKVWAVHSISPSCYDEDRFQRLLDEMKEQNVGVICCPKAAVGMLQHSVRMTRTHNSIARIFDMAHAEIPVRLGVDNIADVLIPNGHWDLYREIDCGADALRFYIPQVWGRIASGEELDDMDREFIRRYLVAKVEAEENG